MLNTVSVDFGTIALLAVVVWLDGWRRWPANGLLVTRSGFGAWDARVPWARVGSFSLVALWAPITVPVILAPEPANAGPADGFRDTDFNIAVARATRRLRRVRAVTSLLRVLGVVLTLWLIAGIPMVTARFGAPGLIYGVAGAFLVAIDLTFGATVALRALGIPMSRSIRVTAQLLSPFSAPRAAEIVTTAAVGPLRSLAPIAALLGEARFLAWVRPWAYDEIAGLRRDDAGADAPATALIRALPRPVLERAIASAVGEFGADGERYCPRCTRMYREIVTTCGHCDDVSLVTIEEQPTAGGELTRAEGH